jgi:hypothetical protein
MLKSAHLILLIFLGSLLICSCSKNPGPGGTSSIQGKIWTRQYNKYFSALEFEYWAKDETVYIVYGNDFSYDDKTSTDYRGQFEFKFLRKGSYKLFVYTTDSAAVAGPPYNAQAPDKAIVKDIEITSNNQVVDAGEITIIKIK